MASVTDPYVRTRRWRRVEYERLVDLGVFLGERLESAGRPARRAGAPGQSPCRDRRPHRAGPRAGFRHRVASAPPFAAAALDDDSEPEPDVAIVVGEPRDYVRGHPSTAALVVEAADSSLRLDRRLKAGLYARAGLQEYWIVNLVAGALEVHRAPRVRADAAYGWIYESVETLRPPAAVAPLAAPAARISRRRSLP